MTTTERFTIRAAVYLLLIKDDKILLLRRFQTGWRDGGYTLPAGHVDGDETMREAMVREAAEELGITVVPEQLRFMHVMHQHERHEYVDFYFMARAWEGEPRNMEPEKCDDFGWFLLVDLPAMVIPNVSAALTAYVQKEYYSEFVWDAIQERKTS